MRNSDHDLYQQIRNGDHGAFDALFRRYYPALCAYATHFVAAQDAEEVAQNVMVWLWENRKTEAIETSLSSYLFISVKNRCYSLGRRQKVRSNVHNILYDRLKEVVGDPDFYIVEELTLRIEAALAELPPSYREAFEMHRFGNKTYAEIASELGVSPKTVDYRIQQALRLLRVSLKDYLPLVAGILGLFYDA